MSKPTTEIVCCKANKFDACKGCYHSVPHEADRAPNLINKCTEWGECDTETGMVPVRCVKVEKK